MSLSSFKITGKKIIAQIHLWLGLASGLVVFIVALTGAIYAFQPELSKATQPYLSVQPEQKPFLPPADLKRIGMQQFPGLKPTRLIYYGKEGAAVLHFIGKASGNRYYYAVYINPYSGKVLKALDLDNTFFRFILRGHMHLWLPQEIGKPIVAVAALIFFVMVISGIVLWWPTSKARRKTSFKVKWSASPKRLNYDLHNVLGFYACWALIFTSATGVVWGFEWAGNAEYWLFSGGRSKPKIPQPLSVKTALPHDGIDPLNKIFDSVTVLYPDAHRLQVVFPQHDSASVLVRVYPDPNTFYRMHYLYFDQYTAVQHPVKYWSSYDAANTGEKASRMTYDIHVGAIGGLPGRMLVFFSALIGASLPVTGFYIWWGKRKKKKRKPASKTVDKMTRPPQQHQREALPVTGR